MDYENKRMFANILFKFIDIFYIKIKKKMKEKKKERNKDYQKEFFHYYSRFSKKKLKLDVINF